MVRQRFERFLRTGARPGAGGVFPLQRQQAADGVEQFAVVERLDQVGIVVRPVRARPAGLQVPLQGVRREHDNRHADLPLAQRFRQLQAVHARHADIEQEQVRPVPFHQRQAFLCALGFQQRKTQGGQQVADESAVDRLVVHHHHRAPGALVSADPLRGHRLSVRRVHPGEQQRNGKAAAFAQLALHAQLPAHDFRQQVRDGQAEAGAGGHRHPAVAHPLEGFEDAREVVGMNADAGIDDGEFRHLVAVADMEIHLPLAGVLDGVRKQVDEDLPQPFLVRDHRGRQRVVDMAIKANAFGLRLGAEHLHHLFDQLRQPHVIAIDVEPAGLDLGDIQQSLDQVGEVFAVALDDAERVVVLFGDLLLLVEQLGVTENGLQGGAQLVAEAGEVAALGAVGALGLLLGQLQGAVGFLVRLDFVQQQARLAVGLLLGHHAAVVGEQEQPGQYPGHQQQYREQGPQGVLQQFRLGGSGRPHLAVDQGEESGDAQAGAGQQQREAPQARVDALDHRLRQQHLQQRHHLAGKARVRFAAVEAAGIQ